MRVARMIWGGGFGAGFGSGCEGEKLFPRCMKNTAWGKDYISINQPTKGTIINVLNAIAVTLPMYG